MVDAGGEVAVGVLYSEAKCYGYTHAGRGVVIARIGESIVEVLYSLHHLGIRNILHTTLVNDVNDHRQGVRRRSSFVSGVFFGFRQMLPGLFIALHFLTLSLIHALHDVVKTASHIFFGRRLLRGHRSRERQNRNQQKLESSIHT